jgi:putative hemolysin
MGATSPRLNFDRERDLFDPYCEHLLLRELRSGRIVGTYRLPTADAAKRLGTFCCERQFGLARLRHLRPGLVEIGRACIDPEVRTTIAAAMLWLDIGRFIKEHGAQHIVGSTSISMADGGLNAATVHRHLAARCLAPIEYRAFPRTPLTLVLPPGYLAATIPLLIKSYIYRGAWIASEPAWDSEFNTTDLLFFLPLARVEARTARQNHRERRAA